MITVEKMRSLNKSGVVVTTDRTEIGFNELRERVVDRIKSQRMEHSMSSKDFAAIVETVIDKYLDEKKPQVSGYVKDGYLIKSKLRSDLANSILSWGKLTAARKDSAIREIQINNSAIFVDKSWGYELLTDEHKNIITWDNPEESFNFIQNTLIFSGERLQADYPLVNAMTEDGFRVSATHPVVYGPHPSDPHTKWPTATYRKTNDRIFTREDYIARGSMTELHCSALDILAKALISFVVVGVTGCGKSTFLDYYARGYPKQKRPIAIQQPTEIFPMVVEDGVIQNNFVSWQVDSNADPNSKYSATQNNLLDHNLRNNSDTVLLGEIRSSEEFAGAARGANMGNEFSTSYHSASVQKGLSRFALELVSSQGLDMDDARELVCDYLTIVGSCTRLGDGTRKMMEFEEVLGYDRTTKEFITQKIYGFKATGVVKAEDGLVDVHGEYRKYGRISDTLLEKMMIAGIMREEMGDLIVEPKDPINGDLIAKCVGRKGFSEVYM